MTFNHLALSTALKSKRNTLGWGLREAGRVIGMSYATLSRIENGKMPELIHYALCCKWLDVSLDTFISTTPTT